ncbi:mechanosensitive ion channel family protein [Nocardioides gilvus]|uniref:mechanosensitive ion channel family protein n=1 Tax=Nocardioides gilvus TaxID=1735589 RepID=UPI001EF61048|nr:mechanosensitive ion channel family protein [Nocardioides gilvus]
MSAFATTAFPRAADQTVYDVAMRLTGSERVATGADIMIGTPLVIAALVLVALLVRWLLHRGVDRIVSRARTPMLPNKLVRPGHPKLGRGAEQSPADAAAATRRTQRAQTIGSLLKSIISGVMVAVVGTMTLSELGFDIAPIIASAGIVGIALGFGAQALVKDFLSGIFMIFEDQYGVGDVVDLGEASGTVEAVSLRVTRLRDINGTVWYVRNGEILRVGNMSQNWARAVLDVTVAYQADLVTVRRVLEEIAEDMWRDEEYRGRIVEAPEVPGVENMTADGVVVRVSVKTAPMEQWAVARELRQRIKARFQHEGIVIPHTRYVEFVPEAAAATGSTADAGQESTRG